MTASVFASRFMPGSDEMMSALSLARSTLPSSSGAAGEQAESSAAIPAKPNIFAISTPRSRKQWVLTLGIGRLARRRDDRFGRQGVTPIVGALRRHHRDFHLAERGPHQDRGDRGGGSGERSEEHTSELQSLMRISYAVLCLQKTTQ